MLHSRDLALRLSARVFSEANFFFFSLENITIARLFTQALQAILKFPWLWTHPVWWWPVVNACNVLLFKYLLRMSPNWICLKSIGSELVSSSCLHSFWCSTWPFDDDHFISWGLVPVKLIISFGLNSLRMVSATALCILAVLWLLCLLVDAEAVNIHVNKFTLLLDEVAEYQLIAIKCEWLYPKAFDCSFCPRHWK